MHLLNDIFIYAWRGSGKYVLVTCVILSVISNVVTFVPMLGLVAWLLLSGYFSAIYFQLIQSSAVGGKEAPEFPDTSNLFEDFLAGHWIIGSLVMSAVGAYTLMTNARILGVVYRERQEELGWL